MLRPPLSFFLHAVGVFFAPCAPCWVPRVVSLSVDDPRPARGPGGGGRGGPSWLTELHRRLDLDRRQPPRASAFVRRRGGPGAPHTAADCLVPAHTDRHQAGSPSLTLASAPGGMAPGARGPSRRRRGLLPLRLTAVLLLAAAEVLSGGGECPTAPLHRLKTPPARR